MRDSIPAGTWIWNRLTPNAPHRYRIEWRTGNVVEFFIDGVSVDSRTASFGAITMRPGISDYNIGGPSLSVDWITQTPYVSPCTFTSRVIDAGQLAHWIDLSRVGATPVLPPPLASRRSPVTRRLRMGPGLPGKAPPARLSTRTGAISNTVPRWHQLTLRRRR